MFSPAQFVKWIFIKDKFKWIFLLIMHAEYNHAVLILPKYLTLRKYTGLIKDDGLTLAIMLNLDGVE